MSILPAPTSDDAFIALWLHGRPVTTQRVYLREVRLCLAWLGKPMAETTLGDLQQFVDSLAGKAPSTQARIIATIKSLFAMAYDTGYLRFNVARPLRSPKGRDRLVERMLTPGQVERMLDAAKSKRDYAILLLLYASGCRVSELAGLCWRDCRERDDSGQITVLGKGNKERAILLPKVAWRTLQTLGPGDASAAVFTARYTGLPLGQESIRNVVKGCAKRAGIGFSVTPHFYRHTHATHALEGGASLPLVRDTLGHANIATTSRYVHSSPNDSSGRYLKFSSKDGA